MPANPELDAALSEVLSDWNCDGAAQVIGNLDELVRAFEFTGFNAEAIRIALLTRHKRFAVGTVLNFKDGASINLEGPKTHINLVTFLITVFLSRGNNLNSVQRYLKSDQRITFSYIITTLDLKSQVKGPLITSSERSTVLTLARIVSAYPLHTLKVALKEKNYKPMITLTEVDVETSSSSHRVLSLPLTAATFTDNLKASGAPWVTFLASIKTSAVIGPKETRDKPDYEDLWRYHNSVLNSTSAINSHKVAFWAQNTKLITKDIVIKSKARVMSLTPEVGALIEEYCLTFKNRVG